MKGPKCNEIIWIQGRSQFLERQTQVLWGHVKVGTVLLHMNATAKVKRDEASQVQGLDK